MCKVNGLTAEEIAIVEGVSDASASDRHVFAISR